MKKFKVLVLVLSTLAINIAGINFGQAAPTTKVLTCGYSSNSDLTLAYGVNSVTITNPNGCNSFGVFASLRVTYGSGSTWTYSKTIGGTTTSGAFNTFDGTFQTGPLGTGDSFTMNLTSATSDQLKFYNDAQGIFYVNFNSQVQSFSPSPVVIGQQVTVTGSNLSGVTNFNFSGPASFGVATSNRTETQLTFTMPETYTRYMGGTGNVTAGTYSVGLGGTNVILGSLIAMSAPAVTAPGAPTIGAATALSPTSASISFTAPASNGGATIESYTATSTPGSITGRVLRFASGSITITGLTPSAAYTFSVTASNSAGTSSASGATVSITMPASDTEISAAALAAKEAAAAKREAEKQATRNEIFDLVKTYKVIPLETFIKAEIYGVTTANIAAVQAEISALPQSSRADLSQVFSIARKYEVVGKIASDQFVSIYSDCLIEIGLIPEGSKHKAALTAAVRKLPQSDRSTYTLIKKSIEVEMANIQARKDRLARVRARNASRYTK